MFYLNLLPPLLLSLLFVALGNAATKPNFIFILSDDQDVHLDSLNYIPLLQRYMAENGTTFNKHYCTVAQCCPSRVTLWTGKAAHNTNVTDIAGDFGGYNQFLRGGWQNNYLPVWLQNAGYSTYYAGKFLNAMGKGNYVPEDLPGWDQRDFMLDPWTYVYYNTSMQRNTQREPRSYLNQYSTDVIAQRGIDYLNDAHTSGKPFFIGLAPVGPHIQLTPPGHTEKEYPHFPIPAKRHEGLFKDVKIRDTKNFNPEQPSGASYVKNLERNNETVVKYFHEYQRYRLRTLQAVDELVESVVNRVDELGLMDNTYIIYTSDNGFHVGQHRMQPGKSCAYEEDINIPLIVRGPDIAKKAVQNVPTTHTDWVPTILKLAGIDDNHGLDGTPIPLTNDIKPIKHEHVSVEFWGNQHFEGKYHSSKPSNTYKSLRIIGDDYSLSYTVWCTNEHELYDMSADSQQMDNLLGTSASSQNIKVGSKTYPVPQVHGRVDALVQVLRTCNGTVCVHPWQKLHPDGNVSTLVDAMDSTYDNFYTQKQVKMKFDKCLDGYFPDNEGPRPIAYGGNRIDSRDYGDWSDWTLGDIDYGDDDWADWT